MAKPAVRVRCKLVPLARWGALALFAGCGVFTSSPVADDLILAFNVATARQAVEVPGEPLFVEQAVFEALPGKAGHHAPGLAAFADGELLAVWYAYDGPHELEGSAIYMARRSAGASEWSEPVLHIDRPQGDGNPVLYAEGDRVWLFQAVVPALWSTADIEMQRSDDRGRSWTTPVVLSGMLGSNVRFPPLRTAEGTLLLPAYDDLLHRSLFFESQDGDAWELRSAIACGAPDHCIQPSVVRLADGRLLAVMRNSGGGWLWVTASDDDGRRWSVPQDGGFPNPASPAALSMLASGNLLLVFNDGSAGRNRLSVALSGDEGTTWPHRRVLVEGDSSYSYPSVAQTPDGLIHMLYSNGRETIQHVTLNEAWVVDDTSHDE